MNPSPVTNPFAALDWIVLGLYFALLVGSGVWLSRKQRGSEDYFLAGRKMPAWAVAVSVLASALSAATFLGAPQQAYAGDLTYLSANLGVILATVVAAGVFIPAFYKHNVTTVYELLERRFGPGAKRAGSAAFMVGRVFASGARVYIAAHALAFIVFGDTLPHQLLIAVWVLSIAGVVYTIAGGIETVIWTDVVQTGVFLVAVTAALVLLLMKIPAPLGEVVAALQEPAPGAASKLRLIDLSLDPAKSFTLWTALGGLMLLNLAAYGTDHDLVQRMLTCKSAWQGSKSVILATLMSIPTVLLFMVIGLLLFVFYNRPDVMGTAAPQGPPMESTRAFLHFITHEMPPGLSGLMIAGLFAVGLGSLDSALNAMSATFVNDFYRPRRAGRSDAHYLKVGRIGVVVWGIMLGLFASLCVAWHRSGGSTFIEFALGVMIFAYSGLLAVFLTALFTKRGSTRSAIAAIITGFAVVTLLQPPVWTRLASLPGLESLSGVTLAMPWHMLIATGLALAVCLAGSKPRGGEPIHSPS